MSQTALVALFLVLLALVLVLFPWLRVSKHKEKEQLSNAFLIKQRLLELEREYGEGLIGKEDLALAASELKLALLDESPQHSAQNSSAKVVLYVAAILTLLVAAGSYYHANELDKLKHWQQAVERLPELGKRVVIEADQSIQVADLQDFALGLRTRLAQQPGDATGWLLLGRVFASVEKLQSALDAFDKALSLEPNKPGTLSSYSQALLMTGQQENYRQAETLLKRLLVIDPQDSNALGMLAVVATELGEDELALKSWRDLQQAMPPSAPMYEQISQRIAALENGQSQEGQSQSGAEAQVTTSITINISLADELKDKLPQQGYLFVFAQDASGKVKFPAAVVKMALTTLPLSITLSDSNAMMPTYTLSQLTDARLVARVSLDENVAQAPGELQGEVVVKIIKGSASAQQIEINKELM
jgi:cytochrome c-type biogenesis protein CcmI